MAIELEKKNLEMHVELQALRDQATNDSLDVLEKKLEALVEELKEIRQLVDDMKTERNNQLMKWGTAIIATLFSAIGMLIVKVLLPLLISKAP